MKQIYIDKNEKVLDKKPVKAKQLKTSYQLDEKGKKVAFITKFDIEKKGDK